jgi:UDP-glucuronate decarboxylase
MRDTHDGGGRISDATTTPVPLLRALQQGAAPAPTAVVTGGAGFVGSHLCDHLVQKGWRVICIDNLYTGDFDNIRPLLNHPRFEFREHDITEPMRIAGPVQRIYNLACAASPRHYQRDPVGTMMTCTLGSRHVLELARQKTARVLLASTSEVYGDPEVHPQREDYVGHVNPIGPRACYDEGKRAAETLFFDYWRRHGVAIKVARIFNTYGPRMVRNDGRVVSNFIIQALGNEQITIYGDGKQTRSFCFVDDLVRGLELLMESEQEFVGPCNLGNPQEITIREIAERIIAQVGAKSRLQYLPRPEDDPRRRRPAIDRAASVLGWHPRVELECGLQATIGYFRLKRISPSKDLLSELKPGQAGRDQRLPGRLAMRPI